MAIKLNLPIWRRAFVHVEARTLSPSGLKIRSDLKIHAML